MIVFDNIIFSLQKVGGISVVWQQLIENISKITNKIYYLEYPFCQDNLFRSLLLIPEEKIIKSYKFSTLLSQFYHPKVFLKDKFIFHSSYFRTCTNPKAINVTTVHDFIYEQGKMTLKQRIRTKLNYRAILNSDAVVCISENTKRDLIKYVPNVERKKIHVIYNGVSKDYFQLEDKPYPEFQRSVLFVGGRQGYKNFNLVVESLKTTDFNLIICGKPLTKEEKIFIDSNIPNRYNVFSFPNNEELNKIYNSVYALVYPSSYEGFGIPVLEAQRSGCPVIAYNSSSIPEIIGNSPLLMGKLSKEEILSKLNLLENPQTRKQIIKEGLKNSKQFSWEKMANDYIALYNSLLKNN